ncbi:MAG: TetR/AcrR family transcriptional regulator [Erysipelotrichaceae bacterium]|nr:TetR/AcrR family transcriptional regulator [Erysipelotrichaceae bacterium]
MKDTRERIINTTIELFKKQGYEETTIAQICKECHITKGTFYYHFANKDDITFAYYEQLYSDLSPVVMEIINIDNAKEQLWKTLEFSIDNTISLTPKLLKSFMISDIQRGMNFFSPYKAYKSSNSRIKQYDMQIQLIKKGQKNNEIKKGNPEAMLHVYTSALMGIAMDWSSNDGYYDEKEELRKVFDTIF